MAKRSILAADGRTLELADGSVESLAGRLRGKLLQEHDDGYDAARTIWNGMIDRRPALIAQCEGTADVLEAVRFARDHQVLLSVRGGGHNIAGNSICERGMVVDLSRMRSIRIDPEARRASVGAGATLADFDHEAQAFGLATPLGINSTTGVAGLTLGGGYGWLARKHGVTCDNLLAADVVTAEGRLVRASGESNTDLLWALRGGGGNFGIVTTFEFALHPVGPNVLCGLVVIPGDQARAALSRYADLAAKLPDDATVWAILRKAPPLPFLPPHVHGSNVLVLALFYAGDPEAGAKVLAPIRSVGKPVGEHIGVQPYTAWQKAFDPLLTPGARNYWKTQNFDRLGDDLLATLVEFAARMPSPMCEVFLGQVGGQIRRTPAGRTAYCHRDMSFVMNVHGRWDDPSQDKACIGWARELNQAVTPHATGGAYVNFMTDDEHDRIKAAYGQSYDRLARIKAKYDPRNLFHMNHNIPPPP